MNCSKVRLRSSAVSELRSGRCRGPAFVGSIVVVASLVVSLSITPSFAQGMSAAQGKPAETAVAPAARPYRIAYGDRITTVIFGQPDLSGELTVDDAGQLRVPLIGDIPAVNLTLPELEAALVRKLERGILQRASVSARVAGSRPVYVVGRVRTPGPYQFLQGLTVLSAIALAGGVGILEGQATLASELLLAEERVHLLENKRNAQMLRYARLQAERDDEETFKVPKSLEGNSKAGALAKAIESERQTFLSNRTARTREIALLKSQIPRLRSEIDAIAQQKGLEERQLTLLRQQVADYEKLMIAGLGRKPAYIEIQREEARIEGNVARLKSEALKADLGIGEIEFKMEDLRNIYHRRVTTELQEVELQLSELTVTLPSAKRIRDLRSEQVGAIDADDSAGPTIKVIRIQDAKTVEMQASLDSLLRPGDIVQVGSLFRPTGGALAALPQPTTIEGQSAGGTMTKPPVAAAYATPFGR